MRKLFTSVLIVVLFFASGCSKSDDSEESGMSSSANGVTINLTWTPDSVDMDLDLDFRNERISISETDTPGETLQIAGSAENGTYSTNIYYFMGSENVNYTLVVSSSEGNELFRTTQSAPPSDGSLNTPIDIITIEKNNNIYTISE